ncbi:hypothetical protein GCM10023258_06860 [Terrabacter aeriphilus]|uniref:TY-Chap N-terminal domain-containing protein n=1 Tax=Terrabacter aeriphilus TaxID=515662 RepID=A0ABP9J553_9MICO
MTDPLEETWEAWTSRLGADLADLAADDWVTFSVRAPSPAPSPDAGSPAPRARRRFRGGRRDDGAARASGAPVPDVFVQVRRLESVLALECIGDTQFEGLTDLTPTQQSALEALGWARAGDDPEFDVALTDGDAAAALVAESLRTVLGASAPADVDVRRAPRP